ncbi:hypothetical protein IQ07DRAFT_338536 [Pyrenochaeta sp. DS3sAY3a]|nr:hypothetical protein IQ07DRAFT_338536 [Pyrenochaeta sp. DS3sAY3a]
MTDVKSSSGSGMVTLQDLAGALRSRVISTTTSSRQALSDTQYSTGFDILVQGSTNYQNFIFPQLTRLFAPLLDTRDGISVLEIGPGPKSVLGGLPDHQKRKIRQYEAFEPNQCFATSLEAWLSNVTRTRPRFPSLEEAPTIHRLPFDPQHCTHTGRNSASHDGKRGYDVILFSHSMYGMLSKRLVIEQTLKLLRMSTGGVVIVFHRGESLHFDGLVCHQTTLFPTGVIRVTDEDQILDAFAHFVAGFVMHDGEVHKTVQAEWRKVCRSLGYKEEGHPDCLLFRSPDVMAAFTQHAAKLSELTTQLPGFEQERQIKNREARLRRPAATCRPTDIDHIRLCVRWALDHGVGLTIVGGGHSGHCVWDNTIAVDMKAFNGAHIHRTDGEVVPAGLDCSTFLVAEAGCTTGDMIAKAIEAGVTVPLGSRPSVGAGLWLQGGIGHLARLHGLACDAIVGAVVVGVESGQVFCVGYVPSGHQPPASVRPENETDILWALRGAGTNFGIVVSATFKTYTAPTYLVQNWVVALSDGAEAQRRLCSFDTLARKLSRETSTDAYLYWDAGRLHLGATMVAPSTTMPIAAECSFATAMCDVLGAEADDFQIVDGLGLFTTDMYVSRMHGGHGGGKTSSFKRCLFLRDIGHQQTAERLVAAVEGRPSPQCYLHLLQGGGAIGDIAADASAFGCRDWHFACVITGVWPRDQDGTAVARAAVDWVYHVAAALLPLSSGAYGADLGPDPRDAVLASKTFGLNRQRLARLKARLDPRNVLACTCPLPTPPLGPKLILLITGESCAGKDHCAQVWVSMFAKHALTARAVSISEAIKHEYAAATGADAGRLLSDRAYKEQHRTALTAYYSRRVQHEPQLPEEQFLQVVNGAAETGVLLITGMRDEAPVAALSHLVPNSRLLEVHVHASELKRRLRRQGQFDNSDCSSSYMGTPIESSCEALGQWPGLVFDNNMHGNEAALRFFEDRLLPLAHEDLLRLADMVRSTPDFPCPNILFRHVLGISQAPGGLALCTSLLQSHFLGDWSAVAAVACCEVGGIVFASALALRLNIPLILIRKSTQNRSGSRWREVQYPRTVQLSS